MILRTQMICFCIFPLMQKSIFESQSILIFELIVSKKNWHELLKSHHFLCPSCLWRFLSRKHRFIYWSWIHIHYKWKWFTFFWTFPAFGGKIAIDIEPDDFYHGMIKKDKWITYWCRLIFLENIINRCIRKTGLLHIDGKTGLSKEC